MYFPFLRGRQFELLALRDLLDGGRLSLKVVPVIEPVRLSTQLANLMELFAEKGRELVVICNPCIGEFPRDVQDAGHAELLVRFKSLLSSYLELLHVAYYMDDTAEDAMDEFGTAEEVYAICSSPDSVETYKRLSASFGSARVMAIDNRSVLRGIGRVDRILLADRFPRQDRNADYSRQEDEFFSDDHLFYRDEGFVGFSDYSVVGSDFSTVGFAPRAVAIHIVHFGDDGKLMVRHFVSDSNDDFRDPARKYGEAVAKLALWARTQGRVAETLGMGDFLSTAAAETYPGLGNVKRWSVSHHIELVGSYLDKERGRA